VYNKNGKRIVTGDLHGVNIDTFGDPILVIEDYTMKHLENNAESAMITVVPFAKIWPNKFMSHIDNKEK